MSNVADSLKSMKNIQDESNSKTEEDSDLNKQLNLIKLFTTVGDSSNQGSHDCLIITIYTTVSIICSVLLIFQ